MPGKHGESKDEWARDLLSRDPHSLEQALTWNAEDRLSAGSQALVWNEFQELHAALVRRGKATYGWERLYPGDLRILQAKINERVFGSGGAHQSVDSGPMGAATKVSANSLPARDDGRDIGASAVSSRAVLRMVDTIDEGDGGVSEESVSWNCTFCAHVASSSGPPAVGFMPWKGRLCFLASATDSVISARICQISGTVYTDIAKESPRSSRV